MDTLTTTSNNIRVYTRYYQRRKSSWLPNTLTFPKNIYTFERCATVHGISELSDADYCGTPTVNRSSKKSPTKLWKKKGHTLEALLTGSFRIHHGNRPHTHQGTPNNWKYRISTEITYLNTVASALTRFRRAGRMIQLLLRAVNDMKSNYCIRKKKQADEVLAESATALPGSTENTLKKTDLMFNPADFKARTKGKLSQEAKTILSKSPDNRTPEEIRVVKMSLHSAMEVFSEFPVKMQESLAKASWYESFEPNRVLIRQGHRSETYYLILAGTAVVTVSSPEYGITGDPGIKNVSFLKKGNSFGELALMRHDKRTATVVCKDTVELLAIDREDFIAIFIHRDAMGKPDYVQFLHTIPELEGWPLSSLPDNDHTICIFTYFRRGVVICKDSNESDWIYIIQTGSCRVLKKLSAPRQLFQARSALQNVFELADNTGSGIQKSPLHSSRDGNQRRNSKLKPVLTSAVRTTSSPSSSNSSVTLPNITVGNHRQHTQFQQRHFRKMESNLQMDVPHGRITTKIVADEQITYLQIQKLSHKDIFGLQPILFGGKRASTSVTLVSDGTECILISKRFFLQHLTPTHRRSLEKSMRPYPSEENLHLKLQQQTTWEQYKNKTMQRAIHSRIKANEIMLTKEHSTKD